jgi:hypothetical protein
MVLQTDDFDSLYQKYQDRGVRFLGKPAAVGWRKQVQFVGLYGNHLVLLDTKPQAKPKQ